MSVLELKDISKSFLRHGQEFNVLNGIDLEIESGSFISIEGESGSGKSTLLGILAGLIEPDSGSSVYRTEEIEEGIDTTKLSADEKAKLRRHDIVYMSQLHEIIPELTVSENIRLTEVFDDTKKADDEKLYGILDRLGISDIKDEYPDEISGGELRRLIVARTLYSSPKVVLADEPTNDLDADNRKVIYNIFREMAEEGITVVVATHDEELALATDSRYLLKDGRLDQI